MKRITIIKDIFHSWENGHKFEHLFLYLGLFFVILGIMWCVGYLLDIVQKEVAAIVFATIGSVFILMSHKEQDRLRVISQFYLRESVRGFEDAHNLLRDGNNSRISWISAARLLKSSENIALKITHKEHKTIYNNSLYFFRNQFSRLLGADRNGISGGFFYGVSCWDNLSIDEAAKKSTKGIDAPGIQIISTLNEIDDESLHAIWSFCQFPSEYIDPLKETFTKDQTKGLSMQYPALYEYLNHKEKYISLGGELKQRLSEDIILLQDNKSRGNS